MNVIVYTREGCPLCTKGIAAAQSVFGPEHVRLVDVDLDLALLKKYTIRVPVVETEAGEVIDEGIVNAARLAAFRDT